MEAPSLATASPRLPLVWLSSRMPAAPKTENQIMEKRLGPISTPVINSRMVRPLEIRAIKAPTYGPQAIHVAQKKMVQLPSHSASCGSKALILRLWGTMLARYTPSSWVKVLSWRIVGPTTRKYMSRRKARYMLAWLRKLTPFSMGVDPDSM